jgi:6-phosphogluconolactonase
VAEFRRFDDLAVLQAELAGVLAARIDEAVRRRGRALLALSGGRTPLPLYEQLAAMDLDWPRVGFALVDERWVAVDDAASNEYQLRRALAPALGSGADFTGMKTDAATAVAGLAECETRYAQLPLPFDLVLLGMGPDGHTASLFPGAAGLSAALDPAATALCAAFTAPRSEVTGELVERMSLTLHGILGARQLHLLVTGDDKLRVLQRAEAGAEMPIRSVVLQADVPLQTWWSP